MVFIPEHSSHSTETSGQGEQMVRTPALLLHRGPLLPGQRVGDMWLKLLDAAGLSFKHTTVVILTGTHTCSHSSNTSSIQGQILQMQVSRNSCAIVQGCSSPYSPAEENVRQGLTSLKLLFKSNRQVYKLTNALLHCDHQLAASRLNPAQRTVQYGPWPYSKINVEVCWLKKFWSSLNAVWSRWNNIKK